MPSPIREIGVYTKDGDLIIRREFPLTDKMDKTRIYGKIVVDMPILATQNGVDSTLDPCISLSGEVGTVVGETTLEPGESGYFAVSFPSGNYEALTYTGTLELVEASGTGAILRMPAGATGSYTASWAASCGRSATITVTPQLLVDCLGDGSIMCDMPLTGIGCPDSGSFCTALGCVELTGEVVNAGSNGSVYTAPGTYSITRVQTIWYYSPMMVCNYGTNSNGWGPFVWKKCQFV